MDSIISTFHIDWKIIIAQAINFGIVFAVLYYFALRPLAVLMLKRTEKIVKGIADAKSNATLLEQTRTEYEKVLQKAKLEANQMSKDSKKEIEEKKASMLEDARNEVKGIIDSGKKVMEAEKTKMVEDAKKEIASLAMLATEKLIKSKGDLNNL